jgi:CoA:oxalate CoA-transferase
MKVLDGLRVLDFTRVYSGPYATLLLSDMGAEVVKVEHPSGGDDSRGFGPFIGGRSGYFETLNRGKKSLAIDYRSSAGQTILRDLSRDFDILVENFRVGQMASYGLDYTSIAAMNPSIVYASLSGYGQFGIHHERGSYDIVAQAMSGLMSLTGLPELPMKTGPALGDAISGLTLAVAVLGALFRRERTGQGARIDISMQDALFAVMENALAHYSVTGENLARQGNQDGAIAPFDCFAARVQHIVLAIGNERLWAKFLALVGESINRPEFASNELRVKHYEVLRPLIAAWCLQFPAETLLQKLHAVSIPAGQVRDMAELSQDAHLEARDMLLKLSLENHQELLVPNSPIHIEGMARPSKKPAPNLGEANAEILGNCFKLEEFR